MGQACARARRKHASLGPPHAADWLRWPPSRFFAGRFALDFARSLTSLQPLRVAQEGRVVPGEKERGRQGTPAQMF